jgi:hypothetical protein
MMLNGNQFLRIGKVKLFFFKLFLKVLDYIQLNYQCCGFSPSSNDSYVGPPIYYADSTGAIVNVSSALNTNQCSTGSLSSSFIGCQVAGVNFFKVKLIHAGIALGVALFIWISSIIAFYFFKKEDDKSKINSEVDNLQRRY